MSVFSHPLSISPERPLDPTTLAILELIDRLLRKAQIPYMLVGATARDLLLYHVHGHVVTRATYDVDFAVLVDSWPQFGVVKRLFLGRLCAMTKKQYSTPKVSVGTVKKSIAAIASR